MEDQLLELEQLQRQLPLLAKATTTLEDLVGISDPRFSGSLGSQPAAREPKRDVQSPDNALLPERLENAVAATSLVAAELQSMHRQLVTSGLLLQQEETRAAQLQADLVQHKVQL